MKVSKNIGSGLEIGPKPFGKTGLDFRCHLRAVSNCKRHVMVKYESAENRLHGTASSDHNTDPFGVQF
jgi:hypothetical protein